MVLAFYSFKTLTDRGDVFLGKGVRRFEECSPKKSSSNRKVSLITIMNILHVTL